MKRRNIPLEKLKYHVTGAIERGEKQAIEGRPVNQYIKDMKGSVQRHGGLGMGGFQLVVTVSFDSKEFNRIKKKKDPLAAAMAQIKNVVFDATGVRGHPGYSRPSMNQKFPRASKGLVVLKLTFDISELNAKKLGADTKEFCLYHAVDLNTTLNKTREDGHLFAKTALASLFGH